MNRLRRGGPIAVTVPIIDWTSPVALLQCLPRLSIKDGRGAGPRQLGNRSTTNGVAHRQLAAGIAAVVLLAYHAGDTLGARRWGVRACPCSSSERDGHGCSGDHGD